MVKMDVDASATQAEVGASACQALVESLTKMIQAVSKVQSVSHFSGSAADSAKSFAATVIVPTIQAGVLLVDAIDEGLSQLLSDYQSKVDSDSHDSEKLKEDIQKLEQQIHALEQRNNQLSRNSKSKKKHAKSIRSNNSRISSLREQKRELERILEALLEFDSSSPNIFSDVKTYDQAFRLGANQIKNGYDTVTHEFIIPPADELTWTTSVTSAMQQKTGTKFWDNLWSWGKAIISESIDMGFNEVVTKGVEYIGKSAIAFSETINNFVDNNYIYIQDIGEAIGQSDKMMKVGKGIVKHGGDILGVIGFSVGMYDDMKNEEKTFGEALAHNGIGIGITIGFSLMAKPKIGAIAGLFYESVYNASDTVQNTIDSWGHWIDEMVNTVSEGNQNIGQALQLG